ncbi:polysaccharide biosynthesis tyrosine autokinase [Aureimonas sp. ME7]|uniref:polysaccharide biosynthesis tyrosine autokinase n=1 Tax=Aureimonas sp. ME7 TaxID=2744252 RepID=UPI0015FC0C3D|nr:polysaccharide biosynthesis tyrosine autokinase [Aureimonas sp. ME7]
MLQDVRSPAGRQPALDLDAASGAGGGADFIDFDRILAIARRQWRVVAVLGVAGALLGLAYVATAVPQFTASSNLLIDTGGNKLLDELSISGVSLADETTILSQVELLRSDEIAGDVVDRLDLLNNPVFSEPSASPIAAIRGALGSVLSLVGLSGDDDVVQSAQEKRQLAVEALVKNLGVERVGRSSVLEISYTSPDAALAAQIADAFANAYLADQLDSKYEATRRASSWLQQRIEELRQRSLQSDQAVQAFRAENGLISAGGQLVSDQQLSELNTQLITARNEVSTAKARLDRIQELVTSGDTNAVVAGSLDNSVVNALRTRYLDAAKREADISNRLGRDHQQAVRLRQEMAEYSRLMFGELQRLSASYQGDYQVALAREQSLQTSVERATGVSAAANQQQVQLRELEREADTYRNLYQTFLQRYQEAVQQESFPVTEARIITKAQPPLKPSKPKKLMLLALATILGLGAGAGLGAFREFRDRFFRTSEQVKDSLGLEPLGLVSRVAHAAVPRPSPEELKSRDDGRLLVRTSNVSRYVVDHPMSSFAETMRGSKIAADLTIDSDGGKVIGVASVLPGEGKSTVAANLASLLALQGARTLLIDCDLRNPGLTRALAPHATAGLIEALLEDRPIETVTYRDSDTGLLVIPAVVQRRIPHTSELLTSHAMSTLLKDARQKFDYVVVDLPPVNAVVDARAFESRVDGFVFVVEWGRTARRVVRSALAGNPRIADKCLGVVLNKVDADKMRYYQEFGSNEYYNARYASYYRE